MQAACSLHNTIVCSLHTIVCSLNAGCMQASYDRMKAACSLRTIVLGGRRPEHERFFGVQAHKYANAAYRLWATISIYWRYFTDHVFVRIQTIKYSHFLVPRFCAIFSHSTGFRSANLYSSSRLSHNIGWDRTSLISAGTDIVVIFNFFAVAQESASSLLSASSSTAVACDLHGLLHINISRPLIGWKKNDDRISTPRTHRWVLIVIRRASFF
jgi:hypothetical protein